MSQPLLPSALNRPLALASGPADLRGSLQRALDRPAREALEIARKPLAFMLAPALSGAFLVAASSLVAGLMIPELHWGHLARDVHARGLLAAAEALAVVVPGLVVFAGYFRLRAPIGALLAATGIGLLLAGVVSVSLVPLVAFLAVVSRSPEAGLFASELLIPGIALGAAVLVPLRLIEAVDRSDRATWLGRAFAAVAAVAFSLQSLPVLHALWAR
jgi:hypothetical protein